MSQEKKCIFTVTNYIYNSYSRIVNGASIKFQVVVCSVRILSRAFIIGSIFMAVL